jgi:hypothetical protein
MSGARRTCFVGTGVIADVQRTQRESQISGE